MLAKRENVRMNKPGGMITKDKISSVTRRNERMNLQKKFLLVQEEMRYHKKKRYQNMDMAWLESNLAPTTWRGKNKWLMRSKNNWSREELLKTWASVNLFKRFPSFENLKDGLILRHAFHPTIPTRDSSTAIGVPTFVKMMAGVSMVHFEGSQNIWRIPSPKRGGKRSLKWKQNTWSKLTNGPKQVIWSHSPKLSSSHTCVSRWWRWHRITRIAFANAFWNGK